MRIHCLALAAALLLGACAENATGPDVGSGTELETTVNGQKLVLNLSDASTTYYDDALNQGYISGTLTGTPSRTILLRFSYDIDNGAIPTTLGGDAVNIVYTEIPASGSPLNYDCPTTGGTCRITLSVSKGEIVDGTFSATLTERNDNTKTVTIANGKFSARLPRR